MKKILLFIIISMPLFCHAQRTMFAGYDSFCGLPVFIESTSQDAVATIRDNTRIIIVDPSVMANWKLSRIFALAHECGHHILGHLSLHEQFSRTHMNATTRQELTADCWAAKALANNGYYGEIQRAIRDNERQGPMMNGAYPSGMTRASYIADCAGINIKITHESENRYVEQDSKQPTIQCLEQMNQRCMASCQRDFGNSYSTCKNRMCNSSRQIEHNISRCTK